MTANLVTKTLINHKQNLQTDKPQSSFVDNFEKIYDNKKNICTFGDLETSSTNGDNNSCIENANLISRKKNSLCTQDFKDSVTEESADMRAIQKPVRQLTMFDFRKILSQANEEAQLENSFELTLARDINDIISQVKFGLKVEYENDDILANNNETDTSLNLMVEDTETEDTEEDIEECDYVSLIPMISDSTTKAFLQNIPQPESDLSEFSKASSKKTSVVDNLTKNWNSNASGKIINNLDYEVVAQENLVDDDSINKSVTNNKINSVETEQLLDEDILNELNVEFAESDTNSSNGNSQTQQSPEEYGIKALINKDTEVFDVKISNTNNSANASKSTTTMNTEKIIQQVMKHMESLSSGSKVSMVLNPEALGKVNIQLMNTKDGLTAQFTVTTNDARELLMKGVDGLKESLLSQGVGVDNISVKINESEKNSYNSDWTENDGSRGGNKNRQEQKREEKEKGLFEKTMNEVNKEK
ncbi:MAG: flagellar hook-length control protein FliK [bacterium]|nr:flagellar hook-length control protein FliK [bacterium]